MDSRLDRPTDHRRSILLVLLAVAATGGSSYALVNVPRGLYLLGFVELGLAIYAAVVMYVSWRRPYSRWWGLAFLIPLNIVILVGLAAPETKPTVFIWVLVVPVLSYALLGRVLGLALTLPVTTLALAIYLWRYSGDAAMVNLPTLANVLITFCTIWVFFHFYERNREATTRRLRQLATTDPLTGVHNRLQLDYIFEKLTKAANRGNQPLTLLVIDLDHFKAINDRWGHQAGDTVLVRVARMLGSRMRGSDWIFRIGGEEFCVLLPGTGRDGACCVAEALRDELTREQCHWNGQPIPLSASIGIAVCPDDGERLEQLLSLADERMYRAKAAGRNRVVAGTPEAVAES